ncbi:MAG: thiamine pyrophosphate-binding protein [Candidatus Poribacteria bacterium]|nr:thiamine pyrophosphate-binding protein [Candidatus Poribacteria bacterium]
MASAQSIVDELRKQGITHAVGVPDNGSARIYEILREASEIEVITVTREGEAFAIASGLYIGGKKPVIIIQNTGFLESGDAIRGTVVNMKVPVVVFIGYRGYHNRDANGNWIDSVATFLEPTLKAWDLPYEMLETDGDISCISRAFGKAAATSLPAAVLLIGHAT